MLENKILKNPRAFNKFFFNFIKITLKLTFLILKHIFLILENKILKNPRFFNKNFFQFHKNNFKINFSYFKIHFLNSRK